jgi:23S rRNA (uracil747-C5)-methyltransferase
MKGLCRHFNAGTCRSCEFIQVDYKEQLEQKSKRLMHALKEIYSGPCLPPIGSDSVGFRHKAKMVVTGTAKHPVIGLLGEKELDQGREILDCPVHHPKINALLSKMPEYIALARLDPYQIAQKKGELKAIIIYWSESGNEGLVRFVLRSREGLDRIRKNLAWFSANAPEFVCVSVNIQPVSHAILEGEEEIILTEINSIAYMGHRIAPKGFVQTNEMVAQRLYQTAAEWVKEIGIDKFAELYSGQGAFSFFMAPFVGSARGYEINKEAVNRANATAREIGLLNMVFKCSDAAKVGEDLGQYMPDLVLINPPRRGLAEGVSLFQSGNFPYIIYSSCSMESLSRDLSQLKIRYEILKVQIFDMFPHSHHFETLVLLKSKV